MSERDPWLRYLAERQAAEREHEEAMEALRVAWIGLLDAAAREEAAERYSLAVGALTAIFGERRAQAWRDYREASSEVSAKP
jgi:hypothetical protein